MIKHFALRGIILTTVILISSGLAQNRATSRINESSLQSRLEHTIRVRITLSNGLQFTASQHEGGFIGFETDRQKTAITLREYNEAGVMAEVKSVNEKGSFNDSIIVNETAPASATSARSHLSVYIQAIQLISNTTAEASHAFRDVGSDNCCITCQGVRVCGCAVEAPCGSCCSPPCC